MPQFQKNNRLYPALLVAFIAFAVYLGALGCGFILDDDSQVMQNGWVRDFRHIPEIFSSGVWAFRAQQSNYYRPMMYLIYSVNYRLFGPSPWGFHLVNILFHCSVSALVFLVIAEVLSFWLPYRDRLLPPFLGAALFAVHPINTEAVTWVASLPEVSFTFFYLLSFYIYMKAGEKKDGMAPYVMAGFFFFLSSLSKETALTLPILLVGYDLAFRGVARRTPGPLKRYAPFAAAAALYLGMRLNALGGFAPMRIPAPLSGYEHAVNVPYFFAYYMLKLLLPLDLCLCHVFHPVYSVMDVKSVLSTAAVAAYIIILVQSWARKRGALFLGLLLVALPLLPIIATSKISGEEAFYERYLYQSAVGFALLAAALLARVTGPARKGVLAVVVVAIALFSADTVERNRAWKDGLAFWTDASKKSPDAYVPHFKLGVIYGTMGSVDQSAVELEQAVKLAPCDPETLNDMGIIYARKGLLKDAEAEFEKAIRINPQYADAYYNLGIVCEDAGEFAAAGKHLEDAVRLAPFDMDYRDELAKVRMTKKGEPKGTRHR